MADTKITALTENTTPLTTDILPMVDDPAGTPLTQKLTFANLGVLLANPPSDDGDGLGTTSLKWSDLFLASGAVIDFNSGDVAITHSADQIALSGGDLVLSAGTTGIAPLKFQSGTNLTTAEAGAMEYDGTVGYFSHAASARGTNVAIQFITLTSAYTLPNGIGIRKMFNSPTNGAITVKGSTTYWFECMGSLSSMSASSGTYTWGLLGTASISNMRALSLANKGAVTPVAAVMTNITTTASTALVAASTATTGQFMISGKLVVDTGGTIIPAVGNSIEEAPIVGNNATFRIYPIGSNTVQSVGNWS